MNKVSKAQIVKGHMTSRSRDCVLVFSAGGLQVLLQVLTRMKIS